MNAGKRDLGGDARDGRGRPGGPRARRRSPTRRAVVVLSIVVIAALAGGLFVWNRDAIAWWRSVTNSPSVVFAAGDIACDPADHAFKGGNGSPIACDQAATARLLDPSAAAILLLGDDQYECGGLAAYQASFDKTWGAFKALVRPAPGNHEHQATSGTDCDASGEAGGYFAYFGNAAHQESGGHYSFDLGSWHLIALDSNCRQVGGCAAGSVEEQWLRADLAANRQPCVLAYWHHPRWSSGTHGNESQTKAFWDDLYAARADIVLNGHDHDYERFALQSPAGVADSMGIREFVVGTGGRSHDPLRQVAPNSQARNFDTFGVLKLTLSADSYAWSFVPAAGSTFTDSGTGACHQ